MVVYQQKRRQPWLSWAAAAPGRSRRIRGGGHSSSLVGGSTSEYSGPELLTTTAAEATCSDFRIALSDMSSEDGSGDSAADPPSAPEEGVYCRMDPSHPDARRRFVLVDFPGVVKNASKATAMFVGGAQSLLRNDIVLDLCADKDKIWSQPIHACVFPARRAVVRVVVKRRPGSSAGRVVSASLIGHVHKVVTFTDLADFQYPTPYPALLQPSPLTDPASLLAPPPAWTGQMHPRATTHTPPSSMGASELQLALAKPRHFGKQVVSPYPMNPAVYEQAHGRSNLRERFSKQALQVDSSQSQWPSAPPPAQARIVIPPSLRGVFQFIKKWMSEDIRHAVITPQKFELLLADHETHRLRLTARAPLVAHSALRQQQQQQIAAQSKPSVIFATLAFQVTDGPFSRCWIRYGMDPRKDRALALLQPVDFRVPYLVFDYIYRSPNAAMIWQDTVLRFDRPIPGATPTMALLQAAGWSRSYWFLICDLPGVSIDTATQAISDDAASTASAPMVLVPLPIYDGAKGWLSEAALTAVRQRLSEALYAIFKAVLTAEAFEQVQRITAECSRRHRWKTEKRRHETTIDVALDRHNRRLRRSEKLSAAAERKRLREETRKERMKDGSATKRPPRKTAANAAFPAVEQAEERSAEWQSRRMLQENGGSDTEGDNNEEEFLEAAGAWPMSRSRSGLGGDEDDDADDADADVLSEHYSGPEGYDAEDLWADEGSGADEPEQQTAQHVLRRGVDRQDPLDNVDVQQPVALDGADIWGGVIRISDNERNIQEEDEEEDGDGDGDGDGDDDDDEDEEDEGQFLSDRLFRLGATAEAFDLLAPGMALDAMASDFFVSSSRASAKQRPPGPPSTASSHPPK